MSSWTPSSRSVLGPIGNQLYWTRLIYTREEPEQNFNKENEASFPFVFAQQNWSIAHRSIEAKATMILLDDTFFFFFQ